jgi:hypothetical protein
MTLASSTEWDYFYGLNFNCGTASTSADLTLNSGVGKVVFERCNFRVAAQASGSDFIMTNAAGEIVLDNCTTIVLHDNTSFRGASVSRVKIRGGQTISTSPNPLFETSGIGSEFQVEGFDCSSLISSFNFINTPSAIIAIRVRNIKLPNNWSGQINGNAVIAVGSVYEFMNSDDGDTNYRLRTEQSYGSVIHETTIVKTGGATDGVTPISWQVSSNPKAQWIERFVDTPEIVRWNTTVASPITCAIDIIHDSATALTNREVWMDIQYLGTSGRPLSLFASTYPPYNAPSTAQAASGATWDTTGMTNPNPQLLSTVITAQEAGFIHAKVMLAASSKAIYVDPVIQLS